MLDALSNIKPEFLLGSAAFIFAVIKWYQEKRTQRQADERRFRANYLTEVLGALAAGANRKLSEPANRDFALGLERALEKIQFVGTKEQVDLTLDFLNHVESKEFSLAEKIFAKLCTSLRDELRSKFGQEALDPIHAKRFRFVRFGP